MLKAKRDEMLEIKNPLIIIAPKLPISTAWSAAVGVAVLTLIVMIAIIVVLAMPMFKKIQTLTDDINRVTRENIFKHH